MAEEGGPGQLQRWLSLAATVVAPATLLSALLFYFGYVSSREQHAYFGIDVDTIGLSTRDYVMRSPQPLLAPLLVLALVGAGGVLVHAQVRRRLAAVDRVGGSARRARYLVRIRWAMLVAGAVLAAGLALLLGYPYLQDWSPYDLVTPLVLGVGAGGSAYVARIRSLLPVVTEPTATDPMATDPMAAADPTDEPADRFVLDLHRGAVVLAVVLVLASAFWATATVAQWSGRGLARHYATRLDQLPSVILDSQERLYLRSPGVQETALPAAAGQRFHYRYRHLRLLIQGHDRMFLVPDSWSASDSTLLVPLDGSVRVQFQFRNDPP